MYMLYTSSLCTLHEFIHMPCVCVCVCVCVRERERERETIIVYLYLSSPCIAQTLLTTVHKLHDTYGMVEFLWW